LSRWALTERGRADVRRDARRLSIGPSNLRQDGGRFVVDVDERTAPWGRPLRGRIVLTPQRELDTVVALDGASGHRWRPRIPLARVEVELTEPRLAFRGTGYLDENDGDEPLEAAFTRWNWSRVSSASGGVAIAYDVELRSGSALDHGLFLDARGPAKLCAARSVDVGRTRFGLARRVRVEASAPATLLRTLEDGPFYARSVIETTLGAARAHGMHETVCLDRFSSRWVRFLLPFRMRVAAA
jgi:carotenoid 1,2-hydratase